MTGDLEWQTTDSRREARALQNFTCTTDYPKTPNGRRLPHPRQWELEAQTQLRRLSQILRPGDIVLIGTSTADSEIHACAQLQFDRNEELLEVFLAAAGVSVADRGQDGAVADQLIVQVTTLAIERARLWECTRIALTCKIHVSNAASQRMMTRAGWAPHGVPTDYQVWILPLAL